MVERCPVYLEVIGHEEFVEVDANKPVAGSGTAFLHLRTTDGAILRAEISHDRLDDVLALIFQGEF